MASFMKWPKRYDIRNTRQEIYLTRWFLLGDRYNGGSALMLHRIRLPDDDRCHHDHPWRFTTLILWGGYEEEVTVELPYQRADEVITRINRPGRIRVNPATHTHRIARLLGKNCWTLVWRGKKERNWGFVSRLGRWVHWKEFDKFSKAQRVLWCNDDD